MKSWPALIQHVGSLAAVTAIFALSACGERVQEPRQSGAKKADTPAWEGAGPLYTSPDFKTGDRASWEAQLKARNQAQNEYTRVQ